MKKLFFIGLALQAIAPVSFAENPEMEVNQFIQLCRGEAKDFADARTSQEQKAYCRGYIEAATRSFHDKHIAEYMPKTLCFDLGSEVPDWETPIQEAVLKYVKEHPKAPAAQDETNIYGMIAEIVAQSYPCSQTIPAGEDDFRIFGKN